MSTVFVSLLTYLKLYVFESDRNYFTYGLFVFLNVFRLYVWNNFIVFITEFLYPLQYFIEDEIYYLSLYLQILISVTNYMLIIDYFEIFSLLLEVQL